MGRSIIVCWLLALTPGVAGAQSSVEDFELGGSAHVASDDCIRLTADQPFMSGSAWFGRPLDFRRPFELRLSLVLGAKDGPGADGIAFVLHPGVGTGWRGEGMGFTGLVPSIGVEFDTYQNDHLGDPPSDHVAVVFNGDPAHYGADAVPLNNLEDGRRHPLRITWHPTEGGLQVFLDGQARVAVPPDLVDRVFGDQPILRWGMTAATGRLSNDQLICVEQLLLTLRGGGDRRL